MEESVRNCQFCGAQTVTPYRCPECGYLFCREHRLPEQHDCVARRKPPREKPRASRGGWSRRLARLAVVVMVLGAALYLLNLLGIVEISDLMGYLQGFAAGLT